MLVLQVNDKKVKVPVCWEEVTVRVFQSLMSCKEGDNALQVFAAITGTNYTSVLNTQDDNLEIELYRATAFVFNQAQEFRKVDVPKSIRLNSKPVIIPKDLGVMTLGQNFHIRAAMAKAETVESLLSFATAVYLQPLIDESDFDLTRARMLEEQILDLNIFDIYPIGFFLLSKLNNYGGGGLLHSLLRRMNKWRSSLKRLTPKGLMDSMTSQSLTSTQQGTGLIRMWFTKRGSMM